MKKVAILMIVVALLISGCQYTSHLVLGSTMEELINQGTGPLNRALLDVQAKLRAEGDALQSCTKAFLASQAAVRVCLFLWCLFSCSSLWGRASAPTGCSPRVSSRLLSRRPGTPIDELLGTNFV